MVKRKDTETHSPSQNKRTRKVKVGDFSDDEDLSDLEDGEVFNGIRIPSELPPIVSAEENIGPRMVIKNIVANNFKSYYGQVIIGPFHKVRPVYLYSILILDKCNYSFYTYIFM